MKFNPVMRKTIESLVVARKNGKEILNALKTTFSNDLQPDLNVC